MVEESKETIKKKVVEKSKTNEAITEVANEMVAAAIALDREEIMAALKKKIFEYDEHRKGAEEKRLNLTASRFKGMRDGLVEFLTALETKP